MITRLGLAVGLAASGLVLAGCAGGPAGESAPTSSAAPTTSSSDQASGGTSGSGSTSGGSGSTSGSSGTSGTSGTTGTPASSRCTLDELRASVGQTTGEAGQRHTIVIWTNTSSSTCTMTGFGGVDLKGPNDPTFGDTYSLPRSAKKPAKVTLAPGGRAHTTITWLPPQDGPGWTPTQLVVTPPDEVSSAALQWPGGAVLRQDGATHPGTFIDPVAPGTGG